MHRYLADSEFRYTARVRTEGDSAPLLFVTADQQRDQEDIFRKHTRTKLARSIMLDRGTHPPGQGVMKRVEDSVNYQIQTDTARPLSSRLIKTFSGQRPSIRILETSAAAITLAIGVFWLSLVVSPKPTEAGASLQTDPEQITRNAPRDLPSFDGTYQRHTGVLDTLR